MERENFISTLSRSGAPTPGRDFFFAILSERLQDSVCSNRSKSSHFGSFQIRCGLARRMMGKAKSHAIYAAVRHFAKNQTEKLSRYFTG